MLGVREEEVAGGGAHGMRRRGRVVGSTGCGGRAEGMRQRGWRKRWEMGLDAGLRGKRARLGGRCFIYGKGHQ